MSGKPERGKVMTVEGPVSPHDLGITLTHEHTLTGGFSYAVPPRNEEQRELLEHGLSNEMLGEARRDYPVFADLLHSDDPGLISDEVSEFRALGGSTIVDVSPIGTGRAVEATRQIGKETDINFVVACGYYVQASHPPEVAASTAESLAESIFQEVSEGIDQTGIRPGVIGEIGMSQPPHPDEWKVLTAACEVQKSTGLPLYVHPYFGTRSRVAPEIVKHIIRQGVDPARVNLCHMDGYMNVDYQSRVADMGVYISFDTFGLEIYYDSFDYNHNCHDSERERALLHLLDQGYEDQVLISQDVWMKLQLRSFGGYGYGHILRHIVPSLRHAGVDDRTIDRILVENPRRLLTIT